MASPWRVTVCDEAGRRVGQIQDYASMRGDWRVLGAGGTVGTTNLVVPRAHRRAAQLGTLAAGIVVEHVDGGGRVEWSGDVVDVEVTGGPDGTVSVIAEAHDALLRDTVLWPAPGVDVSATAITTLPTAYDVRTGPAESVVLAYLAANIGPAAGIVRRRYAWLVIPESSGRGATVTGRARMGDALTLAQDLLIPSGLAARVVHLDQATAGAVGRLAVEVWEPTQAAGARWSDTAGTATDVVFRATAPTIDDAVAGGGDTDVDRQFTRRARAGVGRWRREAFLDARASDGLGEIRQDVDARLQEASATEQVEFTAVQALPRSGRQTPRFGVDWHLGDIGTVSVLGRPPVTDVIRRVELDHSDPSKPMRVKATVGWPDGDPEQVTAARVRRDTAAIVRS